MKKIIYLCILSCFFTTSYCQTYGLRFSSHETVQEKRTSLNLTPQEPVCLRPATDISFDVTFTPHYEIYFGYIFRFITTANVNIDLVYNQRERNFNFLVGDRAHRFAIDSAQLSDGWNHCNIHIGKEDVSFYFNNRLIGTDKLALGKSACFRMFFGTNNYEGFQTTDIPPMNIRDIRVREEGKLTHYWPLSETAGNQCKDEVQGSMALAANPDWIKTRHQRWEPAQNFTIRGNPSIAFDKENERLLVVTQDSLISYSINNRELRFTRLSQRHDTLLPGNQSIYFPQTHGLYNFYIDQKKFSTYDSVTRRWNTGAVSGDLTQYWQANKFISAADTALYIVGGYGQLKYKNTVQRYSLNTGRWDTLTPGGDYFMPRYLSALGVNASGDTAYIMGGYGSHSGDQVMNPRYYYDLVAFDVKRHTFKTIYHLPEPERQFCFANSLVIDAATQEYYALVYPKDQFNSTLQLIKGSLKQPGYQLLGTTIPYQFHDVQSFADLYYCASGKKMVAVTQYTSKDQVTSIGIYTLDFPPNAVESTGNVLPRPGKYPLLALLLAIAAAITAVWIWLKRRARHPAAAAIPAYPPAPVFPEAAPFREKITLPLTEAPAPPAPALAPPVLSDSDAAEEDELRPEKSTIRLFGPFEVLDKSGADCTRQFTPLLKELFLLITIYTLRQGKGVSSERLYATLWKDKSSKDAQNNRSVNMVKLKGILDKLGTCNMVKESDRWLLHYEKEEIDIDLAAFYALEHHTGTLTRRQVRSLLQLLQRGNFLNDTSYAWLEDIQSEVSAKALNVLSEALARFSNDPALLLEIANCIFLFDPVNEEALRVKCKILSTLGRHSMAKAAFEKFAREYHHMYGEDFQQSFHEVMA